MTVNPSRTIAELKELRALTADENGAQRIAWTDTWVKASEEHLELAVTAFTNLAERTAAWISGE